ncbi:MAG: ABC transporter ATP-binding protein [Bacillota bacterium]|nr:ABC transporter ATP-binding protein [Bacillota bacterium]
MILQGEKLTKYFAGILAVADVDMSLGENEVLGIMGPNGAGKTTLFNLLSGYYRPTKGSVTLLQNNITNCKPYQIVQMGLARTFQLVRPFQELTVLQNVMVGSIFGPEKTVSMSEGKNKAMDVLDFVELSHRAQALGKTLNIQERKRLEIARALASNPRVLLLDEVLAGLTPTESQKAVGLIKKIRKEKKLSIIMVEHVMKALMELSDRLVVLNYGRKIAEGTPDEVIQEKEVIKAYLGEKTSA